MGINSGFHDVVAEELDGRTRMIYQSEAGIDDGASAKISGPMHGGESLGTNLKTVSAASPPSLNLEDVAHFSAIIFRDIADDLGREVGQGR
jgi:hypothetical protein